MPKMKYVGPHDAVDLIHDDGRSETVERNHEVEVSASDRDSLAKQGDSWSEVKRAPKRRRAKKTTPAQSSTSPDPDTTNTTGVAGEES